MMQYLSGVNENPEIGKLFKRKNKEGDEGGKKGGLLKRIGHKIVSVGATPTREAFKLLLDVNFFQLAKKMKAAIEKDSSKVYKFWEKFGGKRENLDKSIERGLKHYEKHHKGKKLSGLTGIEDPTIGSATAVAAAIAAATPILIEAKKLLKGVIGDKKANEGTEDDKQAIDEGQAEFTNKAESVSDAGEKKTDDTDDDNLTPFYKKTSTYIVGGITVLTVGGLIYLFTRNKNQ